MTPIVLAPGLLCDRRVLAAVQERLRKPCVVDLGQASTLEAMARVILSAAPGRFVLAGFSMGGMAGVSVAPERLSGVLLVATHGQVETAERKAMRLRQIERAFAGDFAALVRDELKPAYVSHRDDDEAADLRRLVLGMAMDQGPIVLRRHALALMARPDLQDACVRYSGPLEVIAGEEDRLAPPSVSGRLVERASHGRFTVLNGCGHPAPLERPEVIAAALERMAA